MRKYRVIDSMRAGSFTETMSRAKAKEYRQFGWLVTPLQPGWPLIALRFGACVVGIAVVAYVGAVIGWSIYSVLRLEQ